jgi:hypothetical protein
MEPFRNKVWHRIMVCGRRPQRNKESEVEAKQKLVNNNKIDSDSHGGIALERFLLYIQ